MKRFKKTTILRQLRILSLRHAILPVIMIVCAFILLNLIDFGHVFKPITYQNSFDAYSSYTKGTDDVTLTIPELKYTGYNIMKGDKVTSVYYYDLSSERCMFYKLDMNYDSVSDIPKVITDVTISAKIVELDGITKNMMESFAQTIDWTYDGLESITFPVYIDEHEYNPTLYYILYALIVIAVFYNLYLLACSVILFITPFLHPAYMKLKTYFPDMSYFGMIDAINQNFDEHILVTAGQMYITDTFFINLGPQEVSIMPLNQIVMAYDQGELFSVMGIHIKMNHTLHFRGYRNVKISASHKKATHTTIIMDYLRDNYPSIIWGHTKENIKAYKQILATEKATEKAAKDAENNS